MAQIFDVIALAPGTPWVTDGRTFNAITQTDMSLIEPVTVVDNGSDGNIGIGDTFNGSSIVSVGKFGGPITYDYGASVAKPTGFFVTTDAGDTYLFFPDGTNFEGITELNVIADAGKSSFPIKSASQDDTVTVVCFGEGTRIQTPRGDVPVNELRAGDYVETADLGPMPIRWIWRSTASLDSSTGDQTPVLIKAGSLGPGRPGHDLVVSPQHRIIVGGKGQLGKYFSGEALAPAKSLCKLPGVRRMQGKREIVWHHFACDTQGIVRAEGRWTENLLLGPMVTKNMTLSQLEELELLFGPRGGVALNGPPARPLLGVKQAMRIIERNRKLSAGKRLSVDVLSTRDPDHGRWGSLSIEITHANGQISGAVSFLQNPFHATAFCARCGRLSGRAFDRMPQIFLALYCY